MVDRSQSLLPEDRQAYELIKDKPVIPILNKIDLPPIAPGQPDLESLWESARPAPAQDSPWRRPVMTSAITRQGIEELEGRVRTILVGEEGKAAGESALVSNVRHLEALAEAGDALQDALGLLERGEGLEFVMIDVRTALDRIGAILGLDVGEDVLDRIFQRFCLGK